MNRALSKSSAIFGTTCARRCKLANHGTMKMKDTAIPRQIDAASLAKDEQIAQRRIRLRKWTIITLRIAVLVFVLGGWEMSARLKWIDPFFFSMPSLIYLQLVEWFTNGTSQGPLWVQVLVTLEETVLGFLIGAAGGVGCGRSLARHKPVHDGF